MSTAYLTASEDGATTKTEARETATTEWWRDPDVVHLWSPFVVFVVGSAVTLALYLSNGVTGAVALTAFSSLAAFLIGYHSASLGKVSAEKRAGAERRE